jgi:predicted permease
MPRFQSPHGRDEIDRDVAHELDFHLEEQQRELMARGQSAEAAEREAHARFGDRQAVGDELRRRRRDTVRTRGLRHWRADLWQDVRMSLRGLYRTPVFCAAAILTLALGIGANSAVFSVVHAVILRPLPYPGADRLVQLWTDTRARSGRNQPEWLTPPDFADWRDQNRTFASMGAYQGWGPTLTGAGDATALTGLAVSGGFFRTLGVPAELGRTIAESDDDANAEPVVVIGHALWQSRFGSDPAVVNKQIQLDGQSWRIVGVMPAAFRAPVPLATMVFRPIRRPATSGCGRSCIVLRAVGRLKPGTTLAQAQHDIGGIATRLAQAYPASNRGVGEWLIPLHDQIVGPSRRPLFALAGAVLLVLLIACVNLANLLLLRGDARGLELSVRAALGAGQGRLVRQLVTEGVVLAVIGGAAGLGLAILGCHWLAATVPPAVRQMQTIDVDGTVVAFTAAISVVAGLLFTVIPAWRSTAGDLMQRLRGTSHVGTVGRTLLQQSLVAGQIALAAMLLVGAGLLLRSLASMERVDLGYRTRGVFFDVVTLPAARYDNDRMTLAMHHLVDALRANAAIRNVQVTDVPPLTAGDQDMTVIPVGEAFDVNDPPALWYRVVSPGYLPLMQMHLVAGRNFEPGDREGSAMVGIVNTAAVQKLWGGKSPIGRTLASGPGPDSPKLTVVGVVATDRTDGPNQPGKAELFVPLGQLPTNGFALAIEPSRGDGAAVAAVRNALHDVDPLLPFTQPMMIDQNVSEVMALPRLYATLIAVFAAAALLLAVIGVYGVMAYVVAQRRREIGVRLALGANASAIRATILWRGLRLVVIGGAIGLAAAAAFGRVLGALLFGVAATDPFTFAAVTAVLAAAALAACWIPARRAMRIDPIVAMRQG